MAWEGLTSAEAASVLGISNVAARSRLHRARHRALQALHGNGGLPVLTTRATRGEVFGSMIPINLGRNIFPAGAANLTWDQMYALPTDPAKLEPVLRSAIESAGPNATAELHSVVADLLPESPASPALREALYEVVANIPGVKLLGHYKDALGRTGTAVERDGETLVIDPNTGQLLADIQGNPSTGLSCGRGCVTYGVAYTYVSEGPASRAPAGR
ncbi:MAG TPA: sigma factor-like helix-turn-helix DNA-binding protein [Streptosporangiaceae bacterium]